MSGSTTIMLTMMALFIGGLYFSNWMVTRRKVTLTSRRKQLEEGQAALEPVREPVSSAAPGQAAESEEIIHDDADDEPGVPHKFIGLSVVIPIVVGVVLATFLIGKYTTDVVNVTQGGSKHAHKIYDRQGRPIVTFKTPPAPDAMASTTNSMDASRVTEIRVVISDDSLETTDEVLNKCTLRQAIIIRNKKVECMGLKQLEKLVNQTVEDRRMKLEPMSTPGAKSGKVSPLKQSIFAVVEPATTTTTTTKEVPKPWQDRYAEVFYFLALVLGILGKFYWDYSAEKAATNKEVPFDVHLIVMSFIVACLVYYSIQQGLEKEASKLSIRGALFAFNNGFMWQVILKDIQRRPSAPARQPRKPRSAVTP